MSDETHGTGSIRRGRRALFTDPSELAGGSGGPEADPPSVPGRGERDRDGSPSTPGRAGRDPGPSTPPDSTGAGGHDAAGPDGGPRVRVECSACGAVTRRPLVRAVGDSLRPFAWWVPVKRYSRRLFCPACGSKAWCRVDWLSAVRPEEGTGGSTGRP